MYEKVKDKLSLGTSFEFVLRINRLGKTYERSWFCILIHHYTEWDNFLTEEGTYIWIFPI